MLVTVYGMSLELPDHDTVIAKRLQSGPYEEPSVNRVMGWLRDGDVVIEGGAHCGYYTCLAARAVGPKGRVYAFEPNTENHKLLTRNVNANAPENVTIINAGLADRDDVLELHCDPENTGAHTFGEDRGGPPQRACVCAIDNLEHFAERVDFVKLDIEGFEIRALRGMKDTVARQARIAMLVEYSPASLSGAGHDPTELLDTLLDMGFNLEFAQHPGRVRTADIQRRCPTGSMRHTNLWCVKGT